MTEAAQQVAQGVGVVVVGQEGHDDEGQEDGNTAHVHAPVVHALEDFQVLIEEVLKISKRYLRVGSVSISPSVILDPFFCRNWTFTFHKS